MRQILLQGLPVIAIVERNPDAGFSTGKEETFADRVFAHSVNRGVIGQAFND